jgi:hypothetical protein
VHRKVLGPKVIRVLKKAKPVLLRRSALLAGGSALALHLGHRASIDLDFFTLRRFGREALIAELGKAGLNFRLLSEGEDFIIVELDGVKLSLFRYPYPFLDPSAAFEGIRVAGILDIAAMKMIAVSRRGTKRDFADLYFVLQEIPFHKVAKRMVGRYGPERINPVHIGKSLVCFADAESDPDPRYFKSPAVPWDRVKKFFRNRVRQLVYDVDAALREKEP